MHCVDLEADRGLGAYWENKFCELAAGFHRYFTAHQLGRSSAACAGGPNGRYLLLPDITLWSSLGEHHEVKHKAPTRYGSFGLERYRFKALVQFAELTGQPVYYTIHDHSRAGGRDSTLNRLEDWVAAEVSVLKGQQEERPAPSWVNGQHRCVPVCYWRKELFTPLAEHFAASALFSENSTWSAL
jgi:hypothetical protein